jgi:integrase
MAGLRKQELESVEWADVDFKAGTITVSERLDFTPKDHEQRSRPHSAGAIPRKRCSDFMMKVDLVSRLQAETSLTDPVS